jgi:lariat debranching enzyme
MFSFFLHHYDSHMAPISHITSLPLCCWQIAVVGCVHGEVEAMFETVAELEKNDPTGRKIDLVVCCGDFESVRNETDLACMACPTKYRHMVTFWKYYLGISKAPYPTVFVHGNHEASNFLMELSDGGWVAPNIYYMGFAGVVNFAGIRIAGYSGIYDKRDFYAPRDECSPLTDRTMRTLYHAREYEFFQLSQLGRPVDIVVSHDWPVNVARYGDTAALVRAKPFFREEIEAGTLGGNPAHNRLIQVLRPPYWFAAHMHVEFPALFQHTDAPGPAGADNAAAPADGSSIGASATRFLALDKIVPGRAFLQVVDLPAVPGAPRALCYDEEWLAVLKATRQFYPRSDLTVRSLPSTYLPPAVAAAAAAQPGAARTRSRPGAPGELASRHADMRAPRPDTPVLFFPFDAVPADAAPADRAAPAAAAAGQPPYLRYDFRPTAAELAWVRGRLARALGAAEGGYHPIPPSLFYRPSGAAYRGERTYNRTAQVPGFEPNLQATLLATLLQERPLTFAAPGEPTERARADPLAQLAAVRAASSADGDAGDGAEGVWSGRLETNLARRYAELTGADVGEAALTTITPEARAYAEAAAAEQAEAEAASGVASADAVAGTHGHGGSHDSAPPLAAVPAAEEMDAEEAEMLAAFAAARRQKASDERAKSEAAATTTTAAATALGAMDADDDDSAAIAALFAD